MASTTYQDYNQNTPIVAAWLNDINNGIYSPGGVPRVSSLIPVAWARFSVAGGVATIQQSVNITSVTRTGAGVFVVTYGSSLTNATNCYEISMNIAGFVSYTSEAVNSVTISTANPLNTPTDPGSCCVVILGAN